MNDPKGHKWRENENKLYTFCEDCGLVKRQDGPYVRCRGLTPDERRWRAYAEAAKARRAAENSNE